MSIMNSRIHFTIFVLISAAISACAGPRVTVWESDTAKYEWGSMYAWISNGLKPDDQRTDVLTHVLFNFDLDQNFMNDGCEAYFNNLTLVETKNEITVLDIDFQISQRRTVRLGGQINLVDHEFHNRKDHEAYEVIASLIVACGDIETAYAFNEVIEPRRVQPVMWEQ
jgi:hypothetical protein